MTSQYPVTLSLYAMATRFEFLLHGDDHARLRAAGEEALAEIERLDKQLSFYNPASEISLLNAQASRAPVRADARLFSLIERCADLNRLTEGAFDIALGALVRAWGFTGESGSVPDPRTHRRARDAAGMRHVVLKADARTVRFDSYGVSIDLGAIGKGYAIERAIAILRECGVTSALVHGGTSTVYGIGSPPDRFGWRVAVRDPANEKRSAEIVKLHDSGLSVSTGHGKSFEESGVEYGHVIDPRSGDTVFGTALAAVTGPSPTDCDALSTALLVLGREWLTALHERFPGYRGIALSSS